jgi:predicted DNA-binding antitoxin AbrB/MazE fold protein
MTIDAIYTGGVFKPLQKVEIPENQRVQIDIRPSVSEIDAWIEGTRQLHERILARSGVLPDSTPLIAEDRLR